MIPLSGTIWIYDVDDVGIRHTLFRNLKEMRDLLKSYISCGIEGDYIIIRFYNADNEEKAKEVIPDAVKLKMKRPPCVYQNKNYGADN